jgi:hypothetical protein
MPSHSHPRPPLHQVLNNQAVGTTATLLSGLDWVVTNAKDYNLAVVVVTATFPGNASHPLCASVAAAAAKGLVVVAAAGARAPPPPGRRARRAARTRAPAWCRPTTGMPAWTRTHTRPPPPPPPPRCAPPSSPHPPGNDNADLMTKVPAACPKAIAVTALDAAAKRPASFSNWLKPTAAAADRRRVVAAPGVNVLSTTPWGPAAYSGTSCAAPHAAGAAARCFLAGDCALAAGAGNMVKVLDSFWSKFDSDPGYRWSATSVYGSNYYGPWAWAAKW